MNPGLYIVGTPIGNLADMTFRAVETLKTATIILTEDTRHTRILLDHYGITTPMISCHKFNEASRTATVMEKISAGAAVALVTDAGMPAISDPGARTVAACRAAGLPVTVIPGPTALTTAVALAGIVAHAFIFEGFLPHKSGARARRLTELAAMRMPVIFYESPYRVERLAGEIATAFGPCRMTIARELTKHFEECFSGTPAEITDRVKTRPIKGEVVAIVVPGETPGE
jgi:16S rRNA (cytidine1402-2'-O)-methyltransferase